MKIKLELNEQLSRIRTIMNLNEDVKHIYQPTGNSCGPTCIKMVGDFIKGDVGEIDEICIECGTDWVVGTPPDRMKIGLDKLGIKYIEHISEIEPFQSLKNVIDKGNKCIVRTITDGVPHWIVINSYKGNIFNVNDPWKGPIRYNEKQLSAIWKVRDFFFFEIITGNQRIIEGVKIRKMEDKDIPSILKKLSKIFSKTGLNNKEIWEEIKHFDLNMSFVATIDDNVAGFYAGTYIC